MMAAVGSAFALIDGMLRLVVKAGQGRRGVGILDAIGVKRQTPRPEVKGEVCVYVCAVVWQRRSW